MKPDTWSNIAYVLLGAVWLYQGHIGLGALAILLGAIRQIGELKRYQALHSAWHFITAIGFYYLVNA
jgi:L-lactate permease